MKSPGLISTYAIAKFTVTKIQLDFDWPHHQVQFSAMQNTEHSANLKTRGRHSWPKEPWPNWPVEFEPNVNTFPDPVTTTLCPGPAMAWHFSLRKLHSPDFKYFNTSFYDPPHLCFKISFSSMFMGLKIALVWHISNAASSANESVESGGKFAGLLKNEQVPCTVQK